MTTGIKVRVSQLLSPVVLLSLMLISSTGTASTPEIQDYPNAEVKRAGQSEQPNYPVVTSPLKKVNGRITADEEVWLDGKLDRRWLQIPPGHDSFTAFEFYERQLFQSQQDIKVLFQCDRYTCGESTYWANNVFGIAGLNGYDRTQSLLVAESRVAESRVVESRVAESRVVESRVAESRVAESRTGQHRTIYTLYAVQRGNRRVQILFDQFTPDTAIETAETAITNAADEPSRNKALAALDNNGFYDIAGWPAMDQSFSDSRSFTLLTETLKARPEQQWILVIQIPAADLGKGYNLEKQLNAESFWGARILKALEQQGIETGKIDILPTGPAISVESGNDTGVIRLIAVHP